MGRRAWRRLRVQRLGGGLKCLAVRRVSGVAPLLRIIPTAALSAACTLHPAPCTLHALVITSGAETDGSIGGGAIASVDATATVHLATVHLCCAHADGGGGDDATIGRRGAVVLAARLARAVGRALGLSASAGAEAGIRRVGIVV